LTSHLDGGSSRHELKQLSDLKLLPEMTTFCDQTMQRSILMNFQVATSETARDINRRIVLNLIRTHQPISQRRSGLSFRSATQHRVGNAGVITCG
jgi:hypothetical protein